MYLMHSVLFQCLKKNVSAFPVPSAHLSMEPGWGEAWVGAHNHLLWCPEAEELSGSQGFLQAGRECKQPSSIAASPFPTAPTLLCKALQELCLALQSMADSCLAPSEEGARGAHQIQPNLLIWSGQVRVTTAWGLRCQDWGTSVLFLGAFCFP